MAGPVNGLGGQQVPLATTFQPSKDSDQVRQQQDAQQQQKPSKVEARNTTSESKETHKTDNSDDLLEQRLAEALSARSSGSGEVRRGSVVDITV